MTVLAILNPHSLLGDEIKQELAKRKGLWSEVRLLTTDPEQVGALTDFAGNAALVQACDEESLHDVRLALLLPGGKEQGQKPTGLPEDSILLVVDPTTVWPDGIPTVAGLESNSVAELSGSVLVSPSPVVILLATLLEPLKELRPSLAVAQVLMPASTLDQAGLDELFQQTRSIVAMRDEKPTEVFGKQIAFNLLPVSSADPSDLEPLEQILGGVPAVALQVVRAGVFHSLACSLFVSFEEDPGLDTVRDRLEAQPWIEMADAGDLPSPTDAAAREEILVADLRASPNRPGSYQLWAVMDNLTRGGASNVLELVESLVMPAS